MSQLWQEIDAIKARPEITPAILSALTQLRCIGNVGAHPEKDISVIVNVDYDDALVVLGIIEMIIDSTYIAKEREKEKLSQLATLSAKIHSAKNPAP